MKAFYRSMRYRDRKNINFIYRMILGGMLAASRLIAFWSSYRSYADACAEEAARGNSILQDTDLLYPRLHDLVFNKFYYLNDMYTELLLAAAFIILEGCVLCIAGSIQADRTCGWDRFIRTLPISPAMRKKSLLRVFYSSFGGATAVALVLCCGIGFLTVDSDFAIGLILPILTIAILSVTCAVLVDTICSWLVLSLSRHHAPAIGGTGAIVTILMTFLAAYFLCPDRIAWTDYTPAYTYGLNWLPILVVCIAVNIGSCILLGKILELKYE